MESVSPDVAPAVPATPNWGMGAEVTTIPIVDNASSSYESTPSYTSSPFIFGELDEEDETLRYSYDAEAPFDFWPPADDNLGDGLLFDF